MCNFHKLKSSKQEIREHFDVQLELDLTGNAGDENSFPRRPGLIVRRNAEGSREMIMAEWGHPYYKREKGTGALALKKDGQPYAPTPTGNIRHPHYPMFRDYLAPEYRCLVPSNRFAEPDPNSVKGDPRNAWFGLAEQDALYAFAGIWRPWERHWDKGGIGEGHVFAFLTCDPNELVAPIHPKAMPVILSGDDYEAWLTAPWPEAKRLQKPFPADQMALYERMV
ncbi:MAG: SOS response-associated peptidase [Aquisalinus sp.]|nr:SOS response-associated peptidase [Aquisalinus sp.]